MSAEPTSTDAPLDLDAAWRAIGEALGLFPSCIKSGEAWSPTCQRVLEKAQTAARQLRAHPSASCDEAPALFSPDESRDILADAETLWSDLQENRLGGFSGVKRPFYIVAEFRRIIEKYGSRDTGLRWSKDDLDALKPATPSALADAQAEIEGLRKALANIREYPWATSSLQNVVEQHRALLSMVEALRAIAREATGAKA